MYTYRLSQDDNGRIYCIIRSDGWSIPPNPDNTDYQAFLKYQADGGRVYGADEEVPNGQTS